MAIVTIALTDTVPVPLAWVLPPSPVAIRSPIPRGLVIFAGNGAVAAKSAGDETNLSIALTMPTGFAYLPRNVNIRFGSADLVELFETLGFGLYTIARLPSTDLFNMVSPGQVISGAALAFKNWVPGAGAPKRLLEGDDTLTFTFSDMDAGASSAGNLFWFVDLYVFDTDQVDKWEVNTPIPTISHTSF